MSRLVEPRNKSFIKTGWFKKEICIPEMPYNIMDYFDCSCLNLNENVKLSFSLQGTASPFSFILVLDSKTSARKTVYFSNTRKMLDLDTGYLVKRHGEVLLDYDVLNTETWSIKEFKEWPESLKDFVLKFIKALEDAYYKCIEDNKIKEKVDNKEEYTVVDSTNLFFKGITK